MNIKHIEDNFSISEQITLEDIQTLANMEVKTLICNRPEGEEPNQLTSQQLNEETSKHGIKFIHIPSPGREIPAESLSLFIETFTKSEGKIHAYCRTGTRSSIFWGLTLATQMTSEEVINKGNSVGVNLSGVEQQLKAVSKQ